MSHVALDTMILVYGLRTKSPPPGDRELCRRARILLAQLDEEKATVIVPSVVVAELLVPIPSDKHGDFIHELNRRFICPPLDLQAASAAAALWQRHRQLPKREQTQRTLLKADALIVATAKVAGAVRFYSHERKCRSLAKLAGLEPFDLPTHHEDLFVDHETRKGS